MNDLIDRTIDYLEKKKIVRIDDAEGRKVGRRFPFDIDTIFIIDTFFMEKLTYLLEREIVSNSLSGGKLFAGFQTFADFLSRRQRYKKIAANDNRGYVYGCDEAPKWPFECFTPVRTRPTDKLSASWFLLYDNKDVVYSLIARRVRRPANESAPRVRFKGFFSVEKDIAHYAAQYLARVVNAQYGVK